jgi:hypothetical protein
LKRSIVSWAIRFRCSASLVAPERPQGVDAVLESLEDLLELLLGAWHGPLAVLLVLAALAMAGVQVVQALLDPLGLRADPPGVLVLAPLVQHLRLAVQLVERRLQAGHLLLDLAGRGEPGPAAGRGTPAVRTILMASPPLGRHHCARPRHAMEGGGGNMGERFVGEDNPSGARRARDRRHGGGGARPPRGGSGGGDRELEVAEVLERWKSTGEDMGETYVRKHWFRVRTTSGETMRIYLHRQDRRWRLFTVEEEIPGAPPDRA